MWCEVELERNQMSWWLEEIAFSQLTAGESGELYVCAEYHG